MTELEEETLRLNMRYLKEVVEQHGLCPWAKATRTSSRLRRAVIRGPQPSFDDIMGVLNEWDRDSAMDIGLLLFPDGPESRSDFESYASALIRFDANARGLRSSPFAFAAFHPRAQADFSTPERLIPFVRRTPDPTIQVVRMTALDRVRRNENTGTQFVDVSKVDLTSLFDRAQTPTLREKISKANLDTLSNARDEVETTLADIAADREASRRRLRKKRP